VPGTAAPFIVVQDGYNPKYHYSVPTALDNLIHQKKVPVMLAVLVQHGGGDGPGSQRGLEYDTVSDTYTTFIETEVLPESSASTRSGSRRIRKAARRWAAAQARPAR
jgi:enterochelin esterase-like enzyme